ncbi:MAG TPA: PEP-CTERM sorting domain-containing protein [candidate division Zixibacteria bacterium]|nr:PEP-CTERM sorting domain-containing protein [candidate division Zixibacteria bacterium]MDD4917332.1 PEP-CTERM sorting domain-containing protein [candidate division Zixibacteria bacterium]MDM7971520.1 PEP-CTERM sorting domain-containing protein [candidate division Zixibacteria bacterium]HOD67315.1 PEP-CTERM sorting domain-containing protein [candidate division Zixibacteria bacterium]HOZ09044.1 PEP-CTERM sorting domain-containing protein [candidate division Zixibacteria bacterium]
MKHVVLALALVLLLSPLASALSFSGSLASPAGVTASGYWAQQGFKIEWMIEDQPDGSWFYQYWLTDAQGNPWEVAAVSHFTLEISPDATASDFWGYSGAVEFGDLNGMSSAMKLDFTATHYKFYSNRAPVWGDFYAKDGRAGGLGLNEAYNAGFGAPDPTAMPGNGSIGNKILRPDTSTTVVPEPGTMLLMGIGLAGAGVVRRWRRT